MAKKVVGVMMVLACLLGASQMASRQNAAADLPEVAFTSAEEAIAAYAAENDYADTLQVLGTIAIDEKETAVVCFVTPPTWGEGLGEAFLLVVKQYDNGYTAGKMTASIMLYDTDNCYGQMALNYNGQKLTVQWLRDNGVMTYDYELEDIAANK